MNPLSNSRPTRTSFTQNTGVARNSSTSDRKSSTPLANESASPPSTMGCVRASSPRCRERSSALPRAARKVDRSSVSAAPPATSSGTRWKNSTADATAFESLYRLFHGSARRASALEPSAAASCASTSIGSVTPQEHHARAGHRDAHRGECRVAMPPPRVAALLGVLRELDAGIGEPGVGGQHEQRMDRATRSSLLDRARVPQVPETRHRVHAEHCCERSGADAVAVLGPPVRAAALLVQLIARGRLVDEEGNGGVRTVPVDPEPTLV